jgi:DNA-binding MarR family transcriptional regulator
MNTAPTLALDIAVLKQFRVIFRSVRRHFQSVEQACGLSGAQLWALAKIGEIPDITVGRLAQELAIHQTTASNLVDRLVGRKLARKARQKNDQRFISLVLTAAGRKLLTEAPGPSEGLLPDALGKMPYKKLLELHQLLSDVQEVMEHIEADAEATPLSED